MKKQWICLILAAVLLVSCCPSAAAGYSEMTFSDDLVEFLKSGEGFTERAKYIGGYWYIGYGCLVNPTDYPNGITEAGAEELMRKNLQQFADHVNSSFLKKYDIAVTQGQFDAMIAMCYALGPSWLKKGNRLPDYLIAGTENYSDQEIACAFAAWCHIGGGVNTVALQRRIMEANIFLYSDYTFERYGAPLGWNWVILDANGGENELSDVAVYKTGTPYGALPKAGRSGWYFAGWEKPDGTLLLPTDIVTQNLNLKACWSASPAAPPEPEEAETPPEPEESDAPEDVSGPESALSEEEAEALPEEVFPDVPVTAWYARYVAQLVSAGVVNGYEDGTFRPQNDVTWGEALKLILRASGFPEQEPAEPEEKGAPVHWASGYLAFAEDKDYVPGASVGDLNAPVTRDALADLCAATLELEEMPTERPFSDSVRESVLRLYAAGIMEGSFNESGARMFKGSEKLTRAEICAVLVRVRDYADKTWILFSGYRVPIHHDLKRNPYDAEAFSERGGRKTYDDGVTPVRYGIDVSAYQGRIDWAKVAADGVEFAFIRCGYRTYITGELGEDVFFADNIRGALENGLDVGVYFFSQALNLREAEEELNFTLDLIRGWNITLPVVCDWEQVLANGSRSQSPNWSVVTDCIVAFCDGLAAAGYQPMTYFNPSMAYLRLDLPRLERFPKWLAHYVDVTNYYYDFQMWQYGSSGHVNGIDGRVDMDILLTDFR